MLSEDHSIRVTEQRISGHLFVHQLSFSEVLTLQMGQWYSVVPQLPSHTAAKAVSSGANPFFRFRFPATYGSKSLVLPSGPRPLCSCCFPWSSQASAPPVSFHFSNGSCSFTCWELALAFLLPKMTCPSFCPLENSFPFLWVDVSSSGKPFWTLFSATWYIQFCCYHYLLMCLFPRRA